MLKSTSQAVRKKVHFTPYSIYSFKRLTYNVNFAFNLFSVELLEKRSWVSNQLGTGLSPYDWYYDNNGLCQGVS